ncbi:hypothetical protein NP493_953g00009 [Ridgeia piscesae]|uniref:RRM domain-containing protein n=1 Tax=Ridgeia piscesae TaxID=27915 RepID=A0AAD9KJL9_RIDPI|nr:hypothetical protein NP493_953g00009 [Ridgeia piscesae]
MKTTVESAKEEKPRPWETKNASDNGRTVDGEEEDETIAESGRLFARNLPYCCTETELEELFGKYGQLTEVHLPIDTFTRKIKGFAFITFMLPEHAVKAYTALDGSTFQGRMLHLLPGKAKKEDVTSETTDEQSYKKKKEAKLKATAGSSHNWNTLFLGPNAVADVMAERYGASKSDILNAEGGHSVGVRLALGETQVVAETRDFLIDNGVALDAFSQVSTISGDTFKQAAAARSKTVILVKNLPAGTTQEEIRTMFERFGHLGRVVLPPSGITAIVEFLEPSEARSAFRGLAYTKFKYAPLYLEWAPVGVFRAPTTLSSTLIPSTGAEDVEMKEETTEETSKKQVVTEDSSSESDDEVSEPGSTLFIKNLNFDTTQDKLTQIFSKCGKLCAVSISKKKDMKNPGLFLSLGYGFVEYMTVSAAKQALKELQHTSIDGHQVELKVSNRATLQPPAPRQKQDTKKKQTSTKILIRNIPFEATLKEIRELFGVFGEIKSLRIPKKMSESGSHRGFGFVDFLTKQDAKRAFNALCHSTHLYGRRLVLEWADSADTVEQLRRKTADHFHGGRHR